MVRLPTTAFLFFLTVTLSCETGSTPAVHDLPEIPYLPKAQLENFKAPVRQQVRKAYEKVRAEPTNSLANGGLGMILHAHELYEHGAVCYGRAGLLQPDSFRWAYYLGLVQTVLGDDSEAVAAFRRAVQLKPDNLPALLKLAQLLVAAEQWEESTKIYQKILKQFSPGPRAPNFDLSPIALAHYGLGQIQAARGELSQAVASYRRACSSSPGFGAAHYALAMTYRELDEQAKSKEQFSLFQRSKEGRPRVKDPLLARIEAMRSEKNFHFHEGLRLQAEGQLEEAVAAWERALERDTFLWETHSNLMSAYETLGQSDKVEKHYRSAVRLNPEMWETHNNFGMFLQKQRRPREAAQAFRKALEINPFSAQAHGSLAEVLLAQGQLEDASRHCHLALENDPNLRLAHFTLGRILKSQGKHAKAIEHFHETLTVEDARTPLILYQLADAYARAGNRQKAIEYAEQAKQQKASRLQALLAPQIDRLLKQLRQKDRPQ